MGLLFDAAMVWNGLANIKYKLLLSYKGKPAFEIVIGFPANSFPHVCGMQYAKNVDFGRNISEFYGEKLIPAILTNLIDSSKIEKSENYAGKIKGRLKAIKSLEDTLDNDFMIAKFDSKRVSVYSKISADYVIKNKSTGDVFFVFLENGPDGAYCKSAFEYNTVDYMVNQPKLTVLKKTKIVNGVVSFEYIHPHYDNRR